MHLHRFLLIAMLPVCVFAMSAVDSTPGVQVSLLITVESKGTPTPLPPEVLRVSEDKNVRAVTGLTRLPDGRSQLLLLIDDSAGASFDSQIPEVKKFITSLPENVEISVGYMRNGTAQLVSEFTENHQQAANSIRLALGEGGADVSPYDSLSEAINKWPKSPNVKRREVIMISSGIEGLGGGLPPENPYVNAAISSAQKAGVIVYTIYNPGVGHEGHSLWRSTMGQNFLSQLADETGGELYQLGFGTAVSFEPYFADILRRQGEQYVLTFDAKAEKKSGLQPVRITSNLKGFSIAAPDRVYVKASL